MRISPNHPRYISLRIRELLVDGLEKGLIVQEGLLAHGRGEAFDYLLGERTNPSARKAITAAAAHLLTARTPVLSVNGNTAVLVPRQISLLARITPAKVEVNLFHRKTGRENKIVQLLKSHGVHNVLGANHLASARIRGVSSRRRMVDPRGIASADVVLVPLEDGDRALALRKLGKIVLAIDLNPLSRTARTATVSIVDNVTRAFPLLNSEVRKLKKGSRGRLEKIIGDFDNEDNLAETEKEVVRYLQGWSGK